MRSCLTSSSKLYRCFFISSVWASEFLLLLQELYKHSVSNSHLNQDVKSYQTPNYLINQLINQLTNWSEQIKTHWSMEGEKKQRIDYISFVGTKNYTKQKESLQYPNFLNCEVKVQFQLLSFVFFFFVCLWLMNICFYWFQTSMVRRPSSVPALDAQPLFDQLENTCWRQNHKHDVG